MRDAADLTVVKLGGSYAFSRQLPAWLEALASCAGRVVIVPGGGPFADVVRDAQAKMRFSDDTAHRMGLMAMSQFGCAVASLGKGYLLAGSVDAIGHAVRARQVPVWSPLPMALETAALPASWDVTADSLAAWLAARLGTPRVVFVGAAAAIVAVAGAIFWARGNTLATGPDEQRTVLDCVGVVMEEEIEHYRFAVRDLTILESR